jgi:crossover junction endodeoxyribonuclease RusA
VILLQMRVLGTPAPQGSKRHVGRGILVESSKAVAPWREAIVAQAQRDDVAGRHLDGPLIVAIEFYLPRPKAHHGARGLLPSAPPYPHHKPDIDKVARACLDALVQADVIADDARIVDLIVYKRYADDTPPGALIGIGDHEPDPIA